MRFVKLFFGWALILFGCAFALASLVELFIEKDIATTIGILVFFGAAPFFVGYLFVKSGRKSLKEYQVEKKIKRKSKNKKAIDPIPYSAIPLLPPEKHHVVDLSKESKSEIEEAENKAFQPNDNDARFKNNSKKDIREPEYHIRYKDRFGNITDRDITIINKDKWRLYTYCHFRKGERTFTREKIEQMIDILTGELVNPIDI